LHLSDGASVTQIGAELGLLETPEILDSLTMLPGERHDIIIDFSSYAPGTEIILTNSAPAPFPGAPGVGVVPNVMKFIVQDVPGHTNPLPESLAVVEELLEENSDLERIFALFKMAAAPCNGHVHQMWTINGLMWGAITEFPVIGSTEIWTWHNESAISHPMHMHLVAFQVLNRQALNESTGEPEGPFIDPLPGEKGWKDTVNSPPGYRTRVIARFDGFTGLFPYHCHILEHEDHEMMRQYELNTCLLVTNTMNAGPGSLRYAVDCAAPGDTISFHSRLIGDTIVLTGILSIDKNLTITHLDAGTIAISAASADNLIEIEVGVAVELSHLDLISGIGTNGRALLNHGQLDLDDITIYDSLNDPMGNIILNTGFLTTKNNCSILFTGG
jgi:hypothetical protein